MKGIFCPLIGVIGFLTISIVPILADDSLPVLKYFQVDEYNNVIQPYDKVDETLSETTVDVAHLRLECHANYPVQWIFTGNGVPIMNTSLSRSPVLLESEGKSGKLDSFKYVASVFLSNLREHHTGQYECSRTDYRTVVPNLYIYVLGSNLFTSTKGKTIYINPNVTSITLPCSISHPNITVFLFKTGEDIVKEIETKSDDAVAYDPRTGYHINLKQIENPEGSYVCRARFREVLVTDVEYIIASRESDAVQEIDRQKCTSATCKQCENHSDCPPAMSCHTNFKCRDLCTYSVPCGINAACKVFDNRPYCYCERPLFGDPHKQCWILED